MSELNLPRYFVVGSRPVKAVETLEGGMDILAFDWETGEFQRDMSYLSRLFFPGADGETEAEEVSEAQFEARIRSLRREMGLG